MLALPPRARAAAAPSDLRFRVLRKGSPIGEHTVACRRDGDRLTVTTHIDIAVKVLLFTAIYLKHDAEELWQAGWLQAVTSGASGVPVHAGAERYYRSREWLRP